jgi:hypothetical protein
MIVQGVTINGATIIDAAIPTSNTNMLLYLDAGNTSSYPGSGTTWYDISGNNNNTFATNNTAFNSANGGYFNFTDPGYFQTTSSKYNVTYTGKSMFMAGKLTGAMGSGTYRCLFGSNGSNRNFNLYFYYTGSAYELHFAQGPGGGSGGISTPLSYTFGNWFTCGITMTTGGTLIYYFNGQPVSTSTGTFYQYQSTTSENVGASDNYWSGPISIACVYGSVLTSQQMLQAHNAVRTRYGLS